MLWLKGIGVVLLLLMVFAVKSSYSGRVLVSLVLVGGLLYVGLSKKR
jgi:hypothetical protein